MIRRRPANERGHFNHRWLDTYHTFSFAGYRDPQHMGFRALRVINEDTVAPGRGFGTHSHSDMEIISYVLEGALEHKDSTGGVTVLRPGDIQRMSAGTGVLHSEINHSKDEPLRFLQIWLFPVRMAIPPSYEEKTFPDDMKRGRLCLVASPDGRNDSLTIHQDVCVYSSILGDGQKVKHEFEAGRHGWIQQVRGEARLNDVMLGAGDGAAVSDEPHVQIEAVGEAELLLFDLA